MGKYMTGLWRKFYTMIKMERQAEQAEEFRRLEASEMSDAELDARIEAWRCSGEELEREAETLRDARRVARRHGPRDQ